MSWTSRTPAGPAGHAPGAPGAGRGEERAPGRPSASAGGPPSRRSPPGLGQPAVGRAASGTDCRSRPGARAPGSPRSRAVEMRSAPGAWVVRAPGLAPGSGPLPRRPGESDSAVPSSVRRTASAPASLSSSTVEAPVPPRAPGRPRPAPPGPSAACPRSPAPRSGRARPRRSAARRSAARSTRSRASPSGATPRWARGPPLEVGVEPPRRSLRRAPSGMLPVQSPIAAPAGREGPRGARDAGGREAGALDLGAERST